MNIEHLVKMANQIGSFFSTMPDRDQAIADLLARELEASQAALLQQRQAVASLTEELKGQRLFAMQSIDSARAEMRMSKDRTAELQGKIDRLEMTVDQLRMARGAQGGMR